MDPRDWAAAEWGAFGQVGALVIATVAGVLVWLQVRHAAQIREDQTRPFVILDFEFRDMAVYLAVRNIGSTPARDVVIEFDKPLQSPEETVRPEKFAIFNSPIPMMAPGRRYRIFFGLGPDFFKEGSNIPVRYGVKISYTDLEGKRRYPDPTLILDLEPVRHTSVERDDVHQIAQHLRQIDRTLKSWTQSGRLNVKTITQQEWDAQWDE